VVHGGFGRNSFAEIVSDSEQMKHTPIQVCAKTAFVTLTRPTGIIFPLFTGTHFLVSGILRKKAGHVCSDHL
jgi:hypothetical protein